MHNQGDWISATRAAGAAIKAAAVAAGVLPKSPKVPRGTARNLRRKHLQVAYAKRQAAAS
jgi:hypothetical protein